MREAPTSERTAESASGAAGTVTVSVIMPVWNTERFLGEALDSVLAQTFDDFELVVIDDGSTDRSPDIIERYAREHPRIRAVLREHRGITPTLNQGLELARGRYFCTLDSDDVAAPELLEREVAFLDAHPECALVCCRLLLIDADGDPIRVTNVETTHEEIDAAMLGFSSFFTANGYLARRDLVLEVGGFREEVALAEDRDLCLRIAERGRLGNIPEPLYLYRQHLSNVCLERRDELNQCVARVVGDARERRGLEPLGFRVDEKAREADSVMRLHRAWAWWALRDGNVATARKHARACWSRTPWSIESWRLLLCSIRGH